MSVLIDRLQILSDCQTKLTLTTCLGSLDSAPYWEQGTEGSVNTYGLELLYLFLNVGRNKKLGLL